MRHEKVLQIGMVTALVLMFCQFLPAWAGPPPAQYTLPNKSGSGPDQVVNCKDPGPLQRYRSSREGTLRDLGADLQYERGWATYWERQYRQSAKDFYEAVKEKDPAKQRAANIKYNEFSKLYKDALSRISELERKIENLQDELKRTLDNSYYACNPPCGAPQTGEGAGVCR